MYVYVCLFFPSLVIHLNVKLEVSIDMHLNRQISPSRKGYWSSILRKTSHQLSCLFHNLLSLEERIDDTTRHYVTLRVELIFNSVLDLPFYVRRIKTTQIPIVSV